MTHTLKFAAAFTAALTLSACSSKANTEPRSGTMAVQLTDAPFSGDSVSRVDIFVVRVAARIADADSSSSAHAVTDDSANTGGWTTIATPNASINLLALQNGIFVALGQTNLPVGNYQGFRLIIDASKSSVTLKNGAVLTGVSTPNVSFPSATRTGIKILLASPLVITEDDTTTVLVDFNINDSFLQRGANIVQNGLLFKPVIRASIR